MHRLRDRSLLLRWARAVSVGVLELRRCGLGVQNNVNVYDTEIKSDRSHPPRRLTSIRSVLTTPKPLPDDA